MTIDELIRELTELHHKLGGDTKLVFYAWGDDFTQVTVDDSGEIYLDR